jgi:hypothetical protein
MKLTTTKIAILAAAAALLVTPAALAGKPGDPGSPHNDKGKQTSASHAQNNANEPDTGAALPNGKAYGFWCKKQTGTAFNQCVNAMAKAATGQASTPKDACAGVGKQHGQCVAAAAKLLKAQHAHGLTLDRKSILPKACNGAGAKLLVNVHFTVLNDADSGFAGNEWANDTLHRTLKIWQEKDGSYCAVVGDTGSFVTLDGTSPNKTGNVVAGIEGRLQGGYVATFSGTPASSPAYATRGNLGTFDYKCTGVDQCTGTRPSFLDYFSPAPSYELPAWGWIYRTAKNGVWVNQSAGSAGDITS